MKIVTPADNGPRAHQTGHGLDPYESRRRHDSLVRRVTYAREAGLIEAGLNINSKGAVANAAHALVQTYQLGKVSRQQIEEEQRADETRLKGWQAAPPQPGTIHEDEIPRIKYRMAVRAKALAEIATLDLAVMIGSTGKNQKALAPTPHATPWRSGTGYGSSGPKRGKPIGLREYNHCHEPAGSAKGGQFGSGSDCGGGGGGSKEPPSGDVARDWSDYGYGAKGYGQRQEDGYRTERDYPPPPGGWDQYQKLHPPMGSTLRDRVKKIDPAKRLQYAEDRVNRVLDYSDKEQANIGPKSAARQRQVGPSPPTGTIFRDEPSEYGKEPGADDAARITKQRADESNKRQADWRVEAARLEQKYGQDDGRGPIDEYKGIPIYTLRSYTTPYYYISRRHAPLSFRNKVGSVNHYRSFAKIRRIIDGIKKATG